MPPSAQRTPAASLISRFAGQCEAAIAELGGAAPPPIQLFELDLVERGRAWALAAGGERSKAITTLRTAAARAADAGLAVAEAHLRHDVARLGDARGELDHLRRLAARIDGPLIWALVKHCHALVTRRGPQLAAAAKRLAGIGVDLIAAEAAVEAAKAFRAEGLRRRAAECTALADELIAATGGRRSVAMPVELDLVALTDREREVATMAARGLSNRDIAEALVLSPRTVENHLQRIYDKIGIPGRDALAAALAL